MEIQTRAQVGVHCPVPGCPSTLRDRRELASHIDGRHTDRQVFNALLDVALLIAAVKAPSGEYLGDVYRAATDP